MRVITRIEMKVFRFDRADTCPSCKSERSIEAYTRSGYPVHLTLAIDHDVDISNKDILYLRCKNCHKEYFPSWTLGKYPTPMTDIMIDNFMNQFAESYKRSESTNK